MYERFMSINDEESLLERVRATVGETLRDPRLTGIDSDESSREQIAPVRKKSRRGRRR
jgi:hypothetical protein